MDHSKDLDLKTQSQAIKLLKGYGFSVGDFHPLCQDIKDIIYYQKKYQKEREQLPFEIDGLVVKLNSIDNQKKLGSKARSPRYAFAYKFESRKETTSIENIVFQVGRTGAITPVANLKPVDIGGATVSRATLHNFDYLEELDVRVGDCVKVARAGDVIPAIVSVDLQKRKQNTKSISPPKKCPVCQSQVIKEKSYYYCMNHFGCAAQVKWSMVHYGSKRALNISGLGEETVELLFTNNIARNVADLYEIKLETLLKLEGFKQKKSQNLIDALKESVSRPIEKQLFLH